MWWCSFFDGQLHGVEELDTVTAEDGDLAVFHVDDVAGVFDQRRHVGGDEILALAEAEQQRRVLARGVDMIRIVRAEGCRGRTRPRSGAGPCTERPRPSRPRAGPCSIP